MALGCVVVVFLYTSWGARTAFMIAISRFCSAEQVSWSTFEGDLARGVMIGNLELRDIRHFPSGNYLRVQSLSLEAGHFGLAGLSVEAANARFSLRGDEPVIFNISLKDGAFQGNVYTKDFDLADVHLFPGVELEGPSLKGRLKDIDLFVSGTREKPVVRGDLYVVRLLRNAFVLAESPVTVDLKFLRQASRWEMYGQVLFRSGELAGSLLTMKLGPSRLRFTGRPAWPEMDVHGFSMAARTRIDITVRGTRRAPKVVLSSKPYYPQEKLFLMLATGRKWEGLSTMDGREKVTPELAGDFVDYLLFAGPGREVVRFLGLSDISLRASQKKQGVTFTKDLTGRLGIGYGVEREVNAQEPRGLTQRLEGEYQLTDQVLLGAQKEFKPLAHGALSEDPVSPDLPDDRVYMKYKTSF